VTEPRPTPRVSIIIVNWNGKRFLQDCLPTVLDQTYSDYEIILVDNGSDDGSADWVAEQFPAVRLIRNPVNLGFAAGNNQAIHASRSEFIATLNNDTRVEPNWLAELVQVMDGDPSLGACASKMLFADNPHMINSTGICVDKMGIAWDRRGGEPDADRDTESTEVFGACAGAALYRRAMFDQIGDFDPDFFMYFEDVDLAWRARLAGWRCLYVPAARVYHHHSASGVEGSPFKDFHSGRNKVWLLIKNYPLPVGLLYLPLAVLYDVGTLSLRQVLRGNWHNIRGRLHGLWRWRVAWRQRHLPGNPVRRSRWPDGMSPMTAVWRVNERTRHVAERIK
jgi:hypothetical protein